MEKTALMVKEMLEIRGFTTEIHPTSGHPIVVGERPGRSPKTLLIYNHYDVQPSEPNALWSSPPFEPDIREGKLYARGVSDDKGHFLSRLFAIDALLAVAGDLPCGVKFIVEGEEEIGSLHLPAFIDSHQEELAAEACIWEFGGVDYRDIPRQYLGLRGICYVEISTETAKVDVHSGLGGTIFPNAAWRLVWALASLKDRDEKIQLPGFYDPVLPPTEEDLAMLDALPPIIQEYKTRYGVQSFLRGLTSELEVKTVGVFEPSCTICGLTAGYQGAGSKTVLPATASAKVDFRLVPDQNPTQVLDQLRQHLDHAGFSDLKITYLGGGPPARTDPGDPFVKLVMETAQGPFGHPMQPVPLTGVSGPNHAFVHTLGLPVATAGIGYPGANVHAPDENIRLDLYLAGARHIVRILQAFGKQST